MWQLLKNYLWHLPKAVLSSAWYGFPARKLTMIGVTGTKGKTTTAHMIYHILRNCLPGRGPAALHPAPTSSPSTDFSARAAVARAGSPRASPLLPGKVGLISTLGAFFGDEEIDTGLHVTSPDPRELQKLLRMAVDKGITHVVMEVTSNGLDQFRVWGIKFKVAVITNIYPDHLDYHRTMEKYVAAKAKIIRQSEVVVLPEDSPYFSELNRAAEEAGVEVVSVGRRDSSSPTAPQNDKMAVAAVEALSIKDSPWHTPRRILFRRLLRDFKGVKGRLEVVYKNKFLVVIDFAHTPESLEAAVTELRKSVKKNGRLIAVFGCAGERDRSRRRMGFVAARMADFSVITAEDPRTETVEEISEEIAEWARRAGAKDAGKINRQIDKQINRLIDEKMHVFIKIPDRQEAITKAISMAKTGDVVGLFGKGHEKSMCFGKTEYPWSEYEAVNIALRMKFDK